ncbi:hypothetical protein AB7307_10050 [Providencia alcalifaciens]
MIKNKHKESVFLIILCIIFLLPDSLYHNFKISSFSLSTMCSIFLTLLILAKIKISKVIVYMILITLSIIYIHAIINPKVSLLDIFTIKFILSAVSLIILMYTAGQLSYYIVNLPPSVIEKTFKHLFYILLIIGFSSALLIYISDMKNKSMIFFSEPSAYALIFSPIYAIFLYSAKRNHSLIIICISIALALFIENLTLLIGIIFSTLLVKKIKLIYLLISILTLSIVILYNIGNDKISYFTERLDLSNTSNISTLVYLSGLEKAYLDINDSLGIGVGFQKMGENTIIGSNQIALQKLDSENLNKFDGSFISSKLISEFGILGLLFSILYIFSALKIFIHFKSTPPNNIYELIFKIYYIMFTIPLFIRGSGYINPYVFMFFVAFIGLRVTIPKNLKLFPTGYKDENINNNSNL